MPQIQIGTGKMRRQNPESETGFDEQDVAVLQVRSMDGVELGIHLQPEEARELGTALSKVGAELSGQGENGGGIIVASADQLPS